MPAGPGMTYWFLAELVERLIQAALVASWVALGVVVAGGVVRLLVSAPMRRVARRMHGWLHRGRSRAFAQAVAAGDLAAAEVAASVLLRPGLLPVRAKRRRPPGWDERALREGPLPAAAAELAAPGHPTAPCPTVHSRHPGRGHLIAAGRVRPSITVCVRWTGPVEADFTAEAAGAELRGQVRLRRVTAPSPREKVELWVHAEGPGGWRSRLGLWALRRATRAMLQRWAAKDPAGGPYDPLITPCDRDDPAGG